MAVETATNVTTYIHLTQWRAAQMDVTTLSKIQNMLRPRLNGRLTFHSAPNAMPNQKYADGIAESTPTIFGRVSWSVIVRGPNAARER